MKSIKQILMLMGIFSTVTLVWQALELIVIGQIKPNIIDTIMALILTYFIHVTLNLLDYVNGRDRK